MTTYTWIYTNKGLEKLVNCQAGASAIEFKSLAIGDGNGAYYDISQSQTALKHEVTRIDLHSVEKDSSDSTVLNIEAILPSNNYGYTIREIGLIDSAGDLLAIKLYPALDKTNPANGQLTEAYFYEKLIVSNTANITLTVSEVSCEAPITDSDGTIGLAYDSSLKLNSDNKLSVVTDNFIFKDGSIPFTKEQKGVDAASNTGLTTKQQMDAAILVETNRAKASEALKLDKTGGALTGALTSSSTISALNISNPVNIRQSILSASVDSMGEPNFLTSSGLTITLNASSSNPFIATIAGGFTIAGTPFDYPIYLTAGVSLAINPNTYCTLMLSSNGSLGYNNAIYMGEFSYAPTPSSNYCLYFNTVTQKMYIYNVNVWAEIKQIPLANIKTDANNITSIEYFPICGQNYNSNNLSLATPNSINKGSLDSYGVSNLLSYSGTTVNFNVGQNNPLHITDYLRRKAKITSLSSATISTASTLYNLYLGIDGKIDGYVSNRYVQPIEPSNPAINDIWIDTTNNQQKRFSPSLFKYNATPNVAYHYNRVRTLGNYVVAIGYDNSAVSRIFTSSNNGITWSNEIIISSSDRIMDIIQLNNGNWVALGYSKNLYTSSDNGKTWSTMAALPSGMDYFSAITQLSNGNLVILGNLQSNYNGYCYISSDGGVSWKGGYLIGTHSNCSFTDILQLPNGNLLVLCNGGFIHISTDNGVTWANSYYMGYAMNYQSLCRLSNGNIIAMGWAGSTGKVLMSRTDGVSWSIFDALYIDAQNGICQAPNGDILTTSLDSDYFNVAIYKSWIPYPKVYIGSVQNNSSSVISAVYQPEYNYNYVEQKTVSPINYGTITSGILNARTDKKVEATIGAATTIVLPVNVPKGIPIQCEVKVTMGTTAYAITHPTVTWKFGVTPLTPVASKTYSFLYETEDGVNWTGYWTQEGA